RPGEGATTGRALRPSPDGVLTEEQINLVRQAELQASDADLPARDRPRISFRDNALRRFVETQPNMTFREFNRGSDIAKALFILRESDDPQIREDIRVASHPGSLLNYLRTVEPIVLNGCATSGCHGGAAAGRFALYGEARDDATSYTNFYLLNTKTAPVQRRRAGGAFASGDQEGPTVVTGWLVDRDRPDESLLLHYM